MVGYGRQLQGLAIALASLAGFVDALGFITLSGVFVSFMSGNSTRLAVGVANADWRTAALIGGVIALFVLGVILGSVVAHLAGSDGRAGKTAVLAVVTALLTVGAVGAFVGWTPLAIVTMTLAMGAENSVFRRHGETSIALTYMTGALVKIGQRVAAAFFGGPRWSWLPYLGLWGGLMAGAGLGALAHHILDLHALGVAAAFAAILTVTVQFLPDHETTGGV